MCQTKFIVSVTSRERNQNVRLILMRASFAERKQTHSKAPAKAAAALTDVVNMNIS